MINGVVIFVEVWNVGFVLVEVWVGCRVVFLMCGIMFVIWSLWYEWILELEILSLNLFGCYVLILLVDIMI